jgi:hypothetical protein
MADDGKGRSSDELVFYNPVFVGGLRRLYFWRRRRRAALPASVRLGRSGIVRRAGVWPGSTSNDSDQERLMEGECVR